MSIIEKAMERARKVAGESSEHPRQVVAQPEMSPSCARFPSPEASVLPTESARVETHPSPLLVMSHGQDPGGGGEYRLLKEHLLSLREENPAMNVFMVSSPMRHEGKTLVACNLAVSMAQEFDTTVLLIDADLRAPSCHTMLGLPRPKGLSDCLLHNLAFSDVLIHTDIGKLSLLGSGTPIANPSELFTSVRMRTLLHEIKHRYQDRVVIIDTVPILPFAESRALSRLVDGLLLVVRENVTAKAHLEACLRALEGSPLLGLVYNDVSRHGADKEVFELPKAY